MTPENEAWARRAVACPGWRWLEGMALVYPPSRGPGAHVLMPDGARVAHLPAGPLGRMYGVVSYEEIGPDVLPNPHDPATVGCLLWLVREALWEPRLWVQFARGEWHVRREDAEEEVEQLLDTGRWGLDGAGDFVVGPTEFAALVLALEAAGRRR